MLNTPVLFLIFNRPDTTKKVFAKIREIKPRQLFIAADGARENKIGEKELCEETRKVVMNNIDWKCEVKTLFREKNFGCGRAVSEAITWFFKNVEQGIILEDDTVPDLSFFTFCEQLLMRYKDDHRIMHITGSNFYFGKRKAKNKYSYQFSTYNIVWGWATWKRAWQQYKYDLSEYDETKMLARIKETFPQEKHSKYWQQIFYYSLNKKIDTWDYQWLFCMIYNNGLSVSPSLNILQNIGFNQGATHTPVSPRWYSKLQNGSIHDIVHPSHVERNYEYDNFLSDYIYLGKESRMYTIYSGFKGYAKAILRKLGLKRYNL